MATAAFEHVRRAGVISVPAADRVRAAIDRHVASNAAIRTAKAAAVPRGDIVMAAARAKSAKAMASAASAEIDALTARISGMLADRRRRTSIWLRWMSPGDTDHVIAELRARREVVRARYSLLQSASLRASSNEAKARLGHVRAQEQANEDRRQALRYVERRAAILARAKALLARIPALAFLGAKRLLAAATRIEDAKFKGYDPGAGVHLR